MGVNPESQNSSETNIIMTGISLIPIVVPIILAVKFKNIISMFRNTGTTNPQNAKTLEELNLRPRIIFYRLVKRGVLIETISERYYLHEDNLREYSTERRTAIILFLVFLISLVLLDAFVMNLRF
ncbi:MAG: hypothetical protein ACOYMF_14605 [Bacteroidales bacterium]